MLLQNLDGWDYVLLAIAVLIAIYTLVVLMNRHRDKTIEHLRSEAEAVAKAKAKAEEEAAAAARRGA